MTVVRRAIAADAPLLARLRWEFRAAPEATSAPSEPEPAFVDRCTAWMRGELAAGAPWRAWLADDNGAVVGQIWLHVFSKMPNPIGERERHAYLSNLYVKPAYRGGLGEQLLRTAIDFAAGNGVDRIVLWPSPPSVTLYERNGFTRAGAVMEWTSSS